MGIVLLHSSHHSLSTHPNGIPKACRGHSQCRPVAFGGGLMEGSRAASPSACAAAWPRLAHHEQRLLAGEQTKGFLSRRRDSFADEGILFDAGFLDLLSRADEGVSAHEGTAINMQLRTPDGNWLGDGLTLWRHLLIKKRVGGGKT